MMTSMVFEDALPAIDKEYDHPMVKNIVHQLIAEEMGSSTQYFTSSDLSLPNEVDTYLCEKYPHLWGNTRITQSMMKIEEIAHHVSSIRVKDVSDYQSIEAVEASQQQDPQAWAAAVRDHTIKYMHLENQILNLQVAEEYARKESFLAYNQSLEQIAKHYQGHAHQLQKEIHDLQQQRLRIQERFFPQLHKYEMKGKEAMIRKIQCDQATFELVEYLQGKGFSYEEFVKERERKEEEERLREANDPRVNNTVREYEAVTVEDEEDEEEEKHPSKKARQL